MADFDGSLAGALAGMEFSLTHPASDYSNRSQENPLSGRPSDPPVSARLNPRERIQKLFVTEIRFTPKRLWSAKSVS